MFDQKIADFLGLSKKEVKVLNFLKENKDSGVAQVVRGVALPRMSTYLVLEALKKRGLIDYSRKGKRRYWNAVENHVLTAHLMNSVNSLTGSDKIGINIKNSGFIIHSGIDALYKSWESLKNLPANTRVYGIQPTASIKLSLDKISWERIKPIHERIINKPILIDGVLPEDYYPTHADLFAHDKEVQRTSLESFMGRATDMTFVDKRYFKDSETELLILPQSAFLTDWRNEVSIEIVNPIMLAFLRELYQLAKGYGRKVDQNQYIKELLAKINKIP